MRNFTTGKIAKMPKLSRHNRTRRHRRRGTSIIEFALVSPVLLAMVLGIIDFGWLERNSLVIANAAREGARAAALGQPTSNIRTRIINSGSYTLRADSSGNISNGSIVMEQAPSSGNPLVYGSWPSDNTSGSTPRNGVSQGNYIRITVLYNHRSITGLMNRTVAIPVIMRRES